MSIKRTKPKVDRRPADSGSSKGFISTTAKQKEPVWQEVMADKPEEAFIAYSMSGHFTQGTLLSHPTFGKGIVISLNGRKMEVLFSDCKKILTMGA